jgi:hypothetical protein
MFHFLQNFGWKAARPASLRINLASANMATGFYCNCFETTKNHTLIDPPKKQAQTAEPTLSLEAEETKASFRERVGIRGLALGS